MKLKSFLILLFILLSTSITISQEIIEKKSKGIVIDSNLFSIEWNINQTGLETELEVEYEILNETSTEFCIKYKDKEKYIEENIKLSRDVKEFPITKLNENFSIDKTELDLDTEEEIEMCFIVTYDNVEDVSFKLGWESIQVDGDASAYATTWNANENYFITNSGIHIFAYEGAGDDLWACNSSNPQVSNNCYEISAYGASALYSVGITGNTTHQLIYYQVTGSGLMGRYSTNNGKSWGSEFTISGDSSANGVSCVSDSEEQFQCCCTTGFKVLQHINTSTFGSPTSITANYKADYCDIEVDDDNYIWIPYAGSNDDNFTIQTNKIGWGDTNSIYLDWIDTSVDKTNIPSIAIDGTEIIIGISELADAQIYNASSDSPTSWTKTEIDSDASYYVSVDYTSDGDIYMFYVDDSDPYVSTGTDNFYTNMSCPTCTPTLRTNLDDGYIYMGFFSVPSSNYPASNAIKDNLTWLGTAGDGDLHWGNFTVAYTPPSAPEDSCTPPAINENWEIDHSDFCVLTTNHDSGTGKLSYIKSEATGETQCNAEINTSDMGDPNGSLIINSSCNINIR